MNGEGGYDTGSYGHPQGPGQGSQQQQQQPPYQQPSKGFQLPLQTHLQPQQQTSQQYGGGYGGQWQQPQQPAATGNQHQPSFWNPAAAATMVAMAGSGMSNDAMIDFASNAGKSFLQSGSARMVPGLESKMHMLRRYFAVDNHYVKIKMRKILFPFFDKQWTRVAFDPQGPDMNVTYALPSCDENAPDLYLPCMTLITYVLLCALLYGTAGKFNPEVLPDVCTWCFGTQILEVVALRVGFYMMNAPVAILDLFSYTGYKYLGLCINMLAGLVLGLFGFGQRAYYIFFLWTASAASYFMLKTMANNIPVVMNYTGPKREVMVIAFAVSQFVTMWFVSQTKNLT